MTIHWLGVGLSAVPGIKRLIRAGHNVRVWNRTVEKAKLALGDLAAQTTISAFDIDDIQAALQQGDIAVSMLPGDWHVTVAKACLKKSAHFVSSSYISPEMRALDVEAKDLNLVVLNEVGLDPGLDHLLAHDLVRQYRLFCDSDSRAEQHELSFKSYCGGLGEVMNDFRYQFSWSPLGVLKALLSPSKSIKNRKERIVERPWLAVEEYTLDLLATQETFEVYPNRDSLTFIEDYQFDKNWKIKDFVRGTLRYSGWKKAWSEIFNFMENLHTRPDASTALEELSNQLWHDHPLKVGEKDRVVLCVDLAAEVAGKTVWHQGYVLDAVGTSDTTAMARLVSEPVAMMVEKVAQGAFSAGVQPAPSKAELYEPVLADMAQHCRLFTRRDYRQQA